MQRESLASRLGVHGVVNADTTLTALGGSRLAPEALAAAASVADLFVDMDDLHERVGRHLATITRNDAALVVGGASAGITLAMLALRTGPDRSAVVRLAQRGACSEPRSVVVQHPHANPYLPALRLAGVEPRFVGSSLGTSATEIEAALDDTTLAILHVENADLSRGALPFEGALECAGANGVPLVVDAAAQLPPKSNLWRFTAAGADLALFSGGKGLRGPGGTGLAVGRSDLVAAIRLHAPPNQMLGRGFKVGKEEVLALAAAVEVFIELDEADLRARIEAASAEWIEAWSAVPGVVAERVFPGEAGRPFPRVRVSCPGTEWGADLRATLLAHKPPIAVAADGDAILLNAELLEPGEEQIVRDAVGNVLRGVLEAAAR